MKIKKYILTDESKIIDGRKISDGVRITGQKGGLLIRQIDDSDKEMFKHYYNKYNN